MHPFFRQPRALAKMGALIVVFLLSFCLYGLYCINTVTEVKINGPHYKRIIQGKDVIADVLPPPEYLIETYLTAHLMLRSRDSAGISVLNERIARLWADYEERHAFWEANLTEGELKRILIRDSYLHGERLLKAISGEFIPALRAGDKTGAAVLLDGRIREAYDKHREQIDVVVEMAKLRNTEDESRAAVVVQSRIYGQIAVGLFMVLLLAFFSSYVFAQVQAIPSESSQSSQSADSAKPPGSAATRA